MEMDVASHELTEALAIIEFFEKQKIKYSFIREQLKANGVATGRGWKGTKDILLSQLSKDHESIVHIQKVLKKIALESRYAGSRVLTFCQLPEKIAPKDVFDDLWSAKIPDKEHISKFPNVYLEEDLAKFSTEPELVNVKRRNDDVCLTFLSNRIVTIHEEIGVTNEMRESINSFEDVDFIVAYRTIRMLAADVIYFNQQKNIIELRIDAGGYLLNEDACQRYRVKLVNALSDVSSVLSTNVITGNFVNLFPLIDEFVSQKITNFRLTDVSFLTSDGYVNSERCKAKELDIRDGEFHKLGISGEAAISSYKLTVKTAHISSEGVHSNPEILLPGKLTLLSENNPRLNHLIISDCYSESALNSCINTIYEKLAANG